MSVHMCTEVPVVLSSINAVIEHDKYEVCIT